MSGYKNLKRSNMEDLQKEFVPYELALRMKQLGFNESCFAFYNGKHLDLGIWDWEYPAGQKRRDIGECPQAPLFQQAFRWFREEYNLSVSISLISIDYFYDIRREGEQFIDKPDSYKTYEEAELACLEKLFEIVEEKQN
jgi:hypothetical protein